MINLEDLAFRIWNDGSYADGKPEETAKRREVIWNRLRADEKESVSMEYALGAARLVLRLAGEGAFR